MSESTPLNINAATEKEIKECLKLGITKAQLIITKRGQQPEKCFMQESFLWEVKRMEGATKWVKEGLISFGPAQTPRSKRTRQTSRREKKTLTHLSPPLTLHQGDSHGKGDTQIPNTGKVNPSGGE